MTSTVVGSLEGTPDDNPLPMLDGLFVVTLDGTLDG